MGHKVTLDENAQAAISVIFHLNFFPVIFQQISAKLGLYIGSTSRINPVNFQVRTKKVKVTVTQNRKCGLVLEYLQMARYTLNNSSKHPTYFLPMRQ